MIKVFWMKRFLCWNFKQMDRSCQNIFPNILIYNDSPKLVESLCNVSNIFQNLSKITRELFGKLSRFSKVRWKAILDSEGRRLLMIGLSWLLPTKCLEGCCNPFTFLRRLITDLWRVSIIVIFLDYLRNIII